MCEIGAGQFFCVKNPPIAGSGWGGIFQRTSLLFAIWVSFQVFCPALLPCIFKNIKDDYSSTHIPCWKRRKPLVLTTFLFIRDNYPLNSMRVGKCRTHLQAAKSLGYFHSSIPTATGPISFSPHLKGGFYLVFISARLGMTFDPLEMPITTRWDESDSSDI